jgi:hypothetical protein
MALLQILGSALFYGHLVVLLRYIVIMKFFSVFIITNFSKGVIIGKDKVKQTMLSWTRDMLPTTLTQINDKKIIKDAQQIFKSILTGKFKIRRRWCNDILA